MASRKIHRRQWRILIQWLALMGLVLPGFADTNGLLCRILTVRVGGIMLHRAWYEDPSSVMSLHLEKPARLEISFAPIESAANQPIRLLRNLDGVKDESSEAGGEMHLLLVSQSVSNHVLSYHTFTMLGTTEGWGGEVGHSEFRQRRETIVIPAGTKTLQVLLVSAELDVLGTAAITDFKVFRQDAAGQEQNIWPGPEY